ncbi:ATP-binding protein [Streptomyces microflavus]|uniref:ATP-binding protein n=1 Tax=Streptomyces microflavus TaxID=1919 RepID=UPI002F913DB2|nr:ATP-binding protein [Streptomyces microflavus]
MKTTIDVTPAPPQNSSPLSSHLPLDQGLHAVRAARRYADEILTSWGVSRVAVEDAVMVVSELVTNACLHTLNGPVGLRLLSQDRQLVIEVTDTCPETTDLSIPWNDTDCDHGRGLAIVHALTCAFGCSRTADGKTVWAQMNT